MDSMGDADDDYFSMPPVRTTLMTPEARAVTAAGLVFGGIWVGGIFQYLAFFLRIAPDQNGAGWQYTLSAAPTGLFALVGAWIGWSARDEPRLSPTMRGVAVASAIVGAIIALAVAAGIVVAFAMGDDF